MYEDLSNDLPANTSTPGTIAIGSRGDWGEMNPAGDVDWFRVSLTAGQQYQFTIEAGATNGLFDADVGVYSFAGVLLIQATVGQGFQSKHVEYTPAATTDYFLAASGPASLTGTYHVTASAVGATITGTAANDTLTGTSGNDEINGGTGIDSMVYTTGNRANYTVSYSSTYGWEVSNYSAGLGTDRIRAVERLRFNDGSIALDLGSTESAGQTALLIGAALPGLLALDASKQALLGTVIGLFDSGYTMRDLSGAVLRLPIWDVLTGHAAPTNTDIATYLLTNVYGQAPDQATLTAGINALNTESFQGDWLASLALSSTGQTHIGLVGLASTGLVFS